jgi:hypothetical protein
MTGVARDSWVAHRAMPRPKVALFESWRVGGQLRAARWGLYKGGRRPINFNLTPIVSARLASGANKVSFEVPTPAALGPADSPCSPEWSRTVDIDSVPGTESESVDVRYMSCRLPG